VTQVVVIGAGPAGLAAATLLAEQQVPVLLLDEQPAPGGQIYRNIERAAATPALLTALGPDWKGPHFESGQPFRPATQMTRKIFGRTPSLWLEATWANPRRQLRR